MDWSSLILSGRQWETLDREDIGHAAVKNPLTCWSHSSLNAGKEEGTDSPSSEAAWTQHPTLSVISSGYKQKLCPTSPPPESKRPAVLLNLKRCCGTFSSPLRPGCSSRELTALCRWLPRPGWIPHGTDHYATVRQSPAFTAISVWRRGQSDSFNSWAFSRRWRYEKVLPLCLGKAFSEPSLQGSFIREGMELANI